MPVGDVVYLLYYYHHSTYISLYSLIEALLRVILLCYVDLCLPVFGSSRNNPEESTTFPESVDDLVNTSFSMIPAQITIPARFLMERRGANGMGSKFMYQKS